MTIIMTYREGEVVNNNYYQIIDSEGCSRNFIELCRNMRFVGEKFHITTKSYVLIILG